MEKYTIPVGLDLSPVNKDIAETLGALDQVESKSKEAGKAMEESFGKGAKEAEKFEDKLDKFNVGLENVKETTKDVARELGKAFDISKSGKDFAQQVGAMKKRLQEVTEKQKIGIEIDKGTLKDIEDATKYLKTNFDQIKKIFSEATDKLEQNIESTKDNIQVLTADLKDMQSAFENMAPSTAKMEFAQEIASAQQALQEEQAALSDYENQLKQINDANKDLAKTLETANKAIEASTEKTVDLNSRFEDVYGTLQPMTTRLGELEDRLYEMALAGQQNTQEFKELQEEAIKFRRIIQQVDSSIDTFAKKSAVLDITIEAVQGLTGAFTAVQGAVALFGDENEDLEKALLKVNGAMAVLQGLQAVANLLNKESAISALLLRNNTVALTSATEAQTVATTAGTVATKAMGVALKALGIGAIISLLVLLHENWDKVTASVNKFLPAGASVGKIFDTIKSGAVGVGNAIWQHLAMPFKAVTALLDGDMKAFKQAIVDGFSFKKNFTDGYNSQELRNQKAHNKKMEEEEVKRLERELARRKARGEDVTESEITLQKRKLAIYEKDSKEYKENLEKLEDMEDRYYKTKSDKAKADAKEAQRKRDQANKERLQKEKELNEQLKRYASEAEKIRINAIDDAYKKQREQVEFEYQTRKKELEQEKALSAEAEKRKTELLKALANDRARQLLEIDKEELKEKAELQQRANSILADLMEDGLAKELEYIRLDREDRIKEINETFKNDEATRIKLTQAVEANVARETARVRMEFAEEELEREEERQLLAIELLDKYAVKNEKNERAKQIAILETKAEYAQKGLDLLIANGFAIDSLEVLQAKATIKRIKDELEEAVRENSGKGFDFLDFIGLGDLDEKSRQRIKDAGKQVGENLRVITDFIVDQYDRQIEKKQEVIDQLDNEIDDLERRLDKERDLREKGFANNVELIEAELAEKKRQKDEEIKQAEELQAKKIALQKIQMATDTAMQLVNMITASTEIFKSLAGIPFIGVPTAIALIGTMFGAFAATKVKAMQAINDSAVKFRNGGWIEGASHESGGVKYYSADGKNIELEGNEFVVRKNKAKKYGSILEALNDDNFPTSRINESELVSFLERLGISMLPDDNGLLKQASQLTKIVVKNEGSQMNLDDIKRHLSYLANQKREEVVSWEDDLYIYVKKGNKTTKIKKKDATEV